MASSSFFFFFQAEDGIRDLVRSRGLGDVYKRQHVRLGRGSEPQRDRSLCAPFAQETRIQWSKDHKLSLIHI